MQITPSYNKNIFNDLLQPSPHADNSGNIEKYINPEVRHLYDVYSYHHAAAILANSFPDELKEIEEALLAFSITQCDIGTPGGNESDIPKKFSRILRPHGWVEVRIQGDLLIRTQEYDELFLPNGKVKNVKAKFGASTTWMGKLLYRLNAGRQGGCPVLVFGITPKVICDLVR